MEDIPTPAQDVPAPAAPAAPTPAPRDPQATLNLAMLVYLLVNALFAVPLLLFPAQFFDFVGANSYLADDLGGLRWVGAMLAAWGVSGILVLARPAGRAIFVTTGALQLTFGAAGFVYSWVVGERLGSVVFHVVAIGVLGFGALYLWWARFRARRVLAGGEKAQKGS